MFCTAPNCWSPAAHVLARLDAGGRDAHGGVVPLGVRESVTKGKQWVGVAEAVAAQSKNEDESGAVAG